MADSPIRVAIIGHSFIRRIDDCFRRSKYPANYDLGKCLVFHKGLGGFTACDNYEGLGTCTVIFRQKFNKFLKQRKPSIVVLQLGENDVDSTTEPLTLASTLEEIGLMLLKDYQVDKVIICELFTRARPRSMTVDQYEVKRIQTNQILETLLDIHPHVRFWKHRRIFGAQSPIFGTDGVHLAPFGQGRFYRSLRHAIMMASR